MRHGTDAPDGIDNIGRVCDVTLDHLNAMLTFQAAKVAKRQIENANRQIRLATALYE
jgi:hypothetical protein